VNEVLGEVLPLAVGVAVSPVPIIAAILMLLSPAATRVAPAFLVGWLVGIGVAITVFSLLGGLLPSGSEDGARPAVVITQMVLGTLLLMLAVRQWLERPEPGAEPSLPGWMKGISAMTPAKALGLGAALAAANPKNALLGLGAGVAVARADLGTADAAVVIVVWTLLAGATVAIPVVTALVVPDRVAGPLDRLREWLVANNATVMCVLLVVLGVSLVGKSISAL
jgi:hypothetical protein